MARWRIECDVEATRRAHAAVAVGVDCDCEDCRGFVALGTGAFPAGFVALADRLGVDVTRPAELLHHGPDADGHAVRGGWFHVVGRMLSGADAWTSSGAADFVELEPGVEVGCTATVLAARAPFADLPVFQLEFLLRASPWSGAARDPD